MDRISVTDESLKKCKEALKNFNVQGGTTYSTCERKINALLEKIDKDFRYDVGKHRDNLKDLQREIEVFTTNNIAAIEERLSKMPGYEVTKYVKL